MAITNLNFRKLVNKHEKENDPKAYTITVNGDLKSYLPEAISEENSTLLITSNGNPLTEDQDYTVDYTAAVVTFSEMPLSPVVATYYGIGSIIWAEDVIEVQDAIKTINTNAINKNGDTLAGELNVNGFNISNVSTINGINLWNHNHENGDGALIPSGGIENNAIITSKIKDLNVTNEKLSSKENNSIAAVSTNNIQDEAVTNNEIANNTIQNNKIKDGTIENNKIKDGTITFGKLDKLSLLNALYPVGSIYIGIMQTCPLAALGGTWQLIDDGYYLQQKLNNKNLGDLVEAGLPNITGTFFNTQERETDLPKDPTGAFKRIASKGNGVDGDDGWFETMSFDASRSNPIYGKSDTVQTNAVEVNIWKRIS